MEIVCSPWGIVDMERPGQGISDIAGAGFENVMLDMSMCCSAGELENFGKGRKAGERPGRADRDLVSESPQRLHDCLEPMLAGCGKKNLKTSVARMPYLPRDTRRGDLGELMGRLAREALRACGRAGCRTIIVRPLSYGALPADGNPGDGGVLRDFGTDAGGDLNREYFLGLADAARENGVMILLENQCRDVNGHLVRGFCADGSDAAAWVDRLNDAAGEERFGFCMDVGACSLCGADIREFAVTLGRRIKTVILRDCDGRAEGGMLAFTSVSVGGRPRTDWLGFIRGLRETGFDGQLVMDFSDTAGAFSPILRPKLVGLARSVAEYFAWQVGIENLLGKYRRVVLFGAGNMCRNYMKCYGEKYPPLFTCDNNKSLWGTEFCGLEVRSPESLRDLPGDCAIFICNIYYREIETQLRDMGITNPIEYFNDEYMSSFYFDRLERRPKHPYGKGGRGRC